MTLARIEAPDVESFVETHLLRNTASTNLWIGLAKAAGGPWGLVHKQSAFVCDALDRL